MALRALGVGVAYAALAKLVIVVAAFGETVGATFWPGAGLTLAVLLLTPRWQWPWFLVAVAIAEASVDVWSGFDVALALAWAVANTAEPLVAALVLRHRRAGPPRMDRRADLMAFVLAGIVVGPSVGALLGTLGGVVLAGDPWLPRLPRWYVGDAMGVLVIAPALLILVHAGVRRARWGEIRWLAVLAATTLLAVGPWSFSGAAGLPFLVLPLLTLIAMRFGLRGAAAGVLIVAAIVQVVTISGRGPFADVGVLHGLVVAQSFVAMGALTAYIVALLASDLVTREQLESTLRAQALHDSLTGLPNRRLLFDRLAQASRRLAREPGTAALLFVDLDAFKAVNDRHGHGVGDAVLVQSAARLREVVREHDSVARIGGDEFVILVEQLSDGEAVALAARVIAAFDEPLQTPAGPIGLTASVGLATTAEPIADPEAFLSGADRAMYVAKRAGGRRIATAGGLGVVAA